MTRAAIPLALACVVAAPAASATGREMSALGGVVFFIGLGCAIALQLLTLVTYTNLPVRWPRLLRTSIALFVPIVVFVAGWVALALA